MVGTQARSRTREAALRPWHRATAVLGAAIGLGRPQFPYGEAAWRLSDQSELSTRTLWPSARIGPGSAGTDDPGHRPQWKLHLSCLTKFQHFSQHRRRVLGLKVPRLQRWGALAPGCASIAAVDSRRGSGDRGSGVEARTCCVSTAGACHGPDRSALPRSTSGRPPHPGVATRAGARRAELE